LVESRGRGGLSSSFEQDANQRTGTDAASSVGFCLNEDWPSMLLNPDYYARGRGRVRRKIPRAQNDSGRFRYAFWRFCQSAIDSERQNGENPRNNDWTTIQMSV